MGSVLGNREARAPRPWVKRVPDLDKDAKSAKANRDRVTSLQAKERRARRPQGRAS